MQTYLSGHSKEESKRMKGAYDKRLEAGEWPLPAMIRVITTQE